jgi:hypothetical protein
MRRAIAMVLLASCGGGAANAPATPAAPVAQAPVLTTVSVSVTPSTIEVGQTAMATAIGLDQNGAPFGIGAPTWATTPPGVATVSPNGVVTGATPGQATVVASVSGTRGQMSLAVVPVPGPNAPMADLLVTPFNAVVTKGGTLQLVATARDALGNVLAGRQVTWSSSDPAVATVASSGLVSAVSLGSVIIEAASEGQHAGAALTIIGAVDPELVVAIAAPLRNAIVGDTLSVYASVASGFPLATVVASVGPIQVELVPIPVGALGSGTAWVGRLDLSLLRYGPYVLTVIATDSRDHRGLGSVPFERNARKVGGTGNPPSGSKQSLPRAPARVP